MRVGEDELAREYIETWIYLYRERLWVFNTQEFGLIEWP
jgi:hypothetical protein